MVTRSATLRLIQPARRPPAREPLDESGEFGGMGRSLTFPFPQWRERDRYRTVYFDEGRGPPVVFVHGLGGNATHWEFIARGLVGRHRVLGLDLVGCGWSRKPRGPYSVAMLREHLLEFLARRGIEHATLVGHSLGGMVCLSAALRCPRLARSVVLVCSAGVAPLPRWARGAARLFLHRTLLYHFMALGADFITANVFVDGEENEAVRWFRQSAMRDAPGYPNLRDFARVSESLCRDVAHNDLAARLPELRMPVLGVWSDHDKLNDLPRVLRCMGQIRRVRNVVVQRAGHLPMIERWQDTLFHLRRFLDSPP